MKYRISAAMTAAIFSAALVVPARFAARDQRHQRPIHYRVIDLGTLGGTVSSGNTINNRGWIVTSPSHKCDGFSNHACD
jgi:hypothetical protein